jgi:hypothetical protein
VNLNKIYQFSATEYIDSIELNELRFQRTKPELQNEESEHEHEK